MSEQIAKWWQIAGYPVEPSVVGHIERAMLEQITALEAALSRRPAAAPEATPGGKGAAEQPAAEPGLQTINLQDGYEARREYRTDGTHGWLLYGPNGKLVRGLNRNEANLIDSTLDTIARAHLRAAGQGIKDAELLDRLDAWRALESKTGACWASMHFDLTKPLRGQLTAAIDKAEAEIAAIEAREAAAKGEQQ